MTQKFLKLFKNNKKVDKPAKTSQKIHAFCLHWYDIMLPLAYKLQH